MRKIFSSKAMAESSLHFKNTEDKQNNGADQFMRFIRLLCCGYSGSEVMKDSVLEGNLVVG